MKKRILSIALSSVMFFTGVQPIAANASEPFVIYDKEDLMAALALTSEEIGELSEEALAFYDEGISCYTKTVLMFGGDHEMTEQYISVVATEELKTAYRESTGSEEFTFTPEFIEFAECCELSDFNDGGVTYENGYANYHFVYTEEYSEYTNADFYATIYTMLCMSPYLQYVCYEMPGAGSSDTDDDVLMGDFNCDGIVSVLDIIGISKYIFQIVIANEYQLQAADCNADGALDSADLTSLMSYLVGLSESLPSA